MFAYLKKNPFTIVAHPLKKYARTFMAKHKKAIKLSLLSLLFSRPMPVSDDTAAIEPYIVTIFRQGSFTVAIIENEEGIKSIGVAKRNLKYDDDNPARGEHIAIGRAIDNLFVDGIKQIGGESFSTLLEIESQIKMDLNNGDEPVEVFRKEETEKLEARTPLEFNKIESAMIESMASNPLQDQEVRERRKLIDHMEDEKGIGGPEIHGGLDPNGIMG